MNFSSNQIGLQSATVYDISAADLAGANSGQRPDLLAKVSAIFRTPDSKTYSVNADRTLLVAARLPVMAEVDAAGVVTGLTAGGQTVSTGGGGGGSSGLATGRTISVGSAAVLTDGGTIVQASSASAVALTIPNDSTVAWVADTVIAVYQAGVGVASFAAGSGVTLRVPTSYAASVQYDTIFARRVGANEWVVSK